MSDPVKTRESKKHPLRCALCGLKECYSDGLDCFEGQGVSALPTDPEEKEILACAAEIEAEYYCKATRIEELMEFSRRMGYERLGVAFCIGLAEEAQVLHRILANHFDVYSICCKACGTNKESMGLKKVREDRFEVMCNPIGQAKLLASKNTDLNIITGLCMGHDILFTRYSKAPVTTLIVKDRVLAHNPAGALYTGYYKKNRFSLRND